MNYLSNDETFFSSPLLPSREMMFNFIFLQNLWIDFINKLLLFFYLVPAEKLIEDGMSSMMMMMAFKWKLENVACNCSRWPKMDNQLKVNDQLAGNSDHFSRPHSLLDYDLWMKNVCVTFVPLKDSDRADIVEGREEEEPEQLSMKHFSERNQFALEIIRISKLINLLLSHG